MRISDYLQHGENNAVSTQELLSLLHIPNARELQKLIEAARSQGEIILSSCRNNGGYYKPDQNLEVGRLEVAAFCKTMRRRGAKTIRLARLAEKAAAEADDSQFDMWGGQQ